MFSRILGETEAEIVAESRRLMYVALSRAKHSLFVITETGRRSPFLDELERSEPMPVIDWQAFPSIMQGKDWLVVKVSGAFQSLEPLFGDLKADSYGYRDLRWDARGQSWDRVFRVDSLRKDFLAGAPWALKAREIRATGVQVDIFDGLDIPLMRCQIVDGEFFMQFEGGLTPLTPGLAGEELSRMLGVEVGQAR